MKVFLSGSNGMVGRNILAHPKANQYEWIAPSRGELDLTDRAKVRDFFVNVRPDFVIHAAGRVGGIHANMQFPVSFLVENMDMGFSIVLAAQHAGVPKLLNLGSSCMYPKDFDGALTEEQVLSGELEPTNEGYALAKVSTARLASYVSRENKGIVCKTMIPSNLYGKFDKFDPKHSHLIPAILRKLYEAKKNNVEQVEIWGTGEARREFMYAEDLADSIFCALEQFESMPELLNVGLGFDFTVNEYYSAAADVVGFDGTFTHNLTKPVGMKRKLTDVSKASKWGWKSKTSLHVGLTKTYEFFLENEQKGHE